MEEKKNQTLSHILRHIGGTAAGLAGLEHPFRQPGNVRQGDCADPAVPQR